MTEPSLRIKVTDFLATDFEQEVFQELMKLKQMDYLSGVPFPLYFWYDRQTEIVDLKVLELIRVFSTGSMRPLGYLFVSGIFELSNNDKIIIPLKYIYDYKKFIASLEN